MKKEGEGESEYCSSLKERVSIVLFFFKLVDLQFTIMYFKIFVNFMIVMVCQPVKGYFMLRG